MSTKTSILVVEDDTPLLTLLKTSLTIKLNEFEVATAMEGETALLLARQLRPALILLDILLPGAIDGLEVCRRVRADPALHHTRIVIMSALSDPVTRENAAQAGAVDYWVKPIRASGLAERVQAVLNLKPAKTGPLSMATLIAKGSEAAGAVGSQAASAVDLDQYLQAMRSTLSQLEPGDWQEIQAIAEIRLAHRKQEKANK